MAIAWIICLVIIFNNELICDLLENALFVLVVAFNVCSLIEFNSIQNRL